MKTINTQQGKGDITGIYISSLFIKFMQYFMSEKTAQASLLRTVPVSR